MGVDAPQAKLHVFKAVQTSATVETGIYTLMGTDSELVRGVHSIAASGSNTNIGVEAFADNAERNFAVRAIVGTGVGSHNVGVEAHAIGTIGNCVTNLAVRGISNPWSPSCGNSWAAWFDGRGFLQDGPWTTSDATLKQDVEPLSGSLELIGQLAPVSYRHDAGHPMYLGADDSRHIGMLAQDLEQVLPELVVDAVRPPILNEAGEEISPSVNFKAVNYMPLISLLVSGLQEQQVLITEQMNRLDQMEALLLQCCSTDGGVGDHRSPEPIGSNTDQAMDRLLRIVPNPFNTPPTIHYTLERDGRMQLMVTGSDGRILRVLEEGDRSAGPYRHDWHTAHLAPGIYYVTLLLDGEPLVQRAVKL